MEQCPDRTREKTGAERLYYTQALIIQSIRLPYTQACLQKSGERPDLASNTLALQILSCSDVSARPAQGKITHELIHQGAYDTLVAGGRRGCARTHVRNYKGAAAPA